MDLPSRFTITTLQPSHNMSLTSDYASQIGYKIISASDSQNEKEANDDFSPANPSDSLKESSLLEV